MLENYVRENGRDSVLNCKYFEPELIFESLPVHKYFIKVASRLLIATILESRNFGVYQVISNRIRTSRDHKYLHIHVCLCLQYCISIHMYEHLHTDRNCSEHCACAATGCNGAHFHERLPD